MPLYDTGKTPAFAHADDIHFIVRLELIHQNSIALLQVVVAGTHPQFTQKPDSVGAGLFQMSGERLVGPGRFRELY